ncbi:MAG: hypothetical protein LBT89_09045 [Planctomycetaceae bacterium]|nr:hypothetical protein [Planctomycetaceae bacterium]
MSGAKWNIACAVKLRTNLVAPPTIVCHYHTRPRLKLKRHPISVMINVYRLSLTQITGYSGYRNAISPYFEK